MSNTSPITRLLDKLAAPSAFSSARSLTPGSSSKPKAPTSSLGKAPTLNRAPSSTANAPSALSTSTTSQQAKPSLSLQTPQLGKPLPSSLQPAGGPQNALQANPAQLPNPALKTTQRAPQEPINQMPDNPTTPNAQIAQATPTPDPLLPNALKTACSSTCSKKGKKRPVMFNKAKKAHIRKVASAIMPLYLGHLALKAQSLPHTKAASIAVKTNTLAKIARVMAVTHDLPKTIKAVFPTKTAQEHTKLAMSLARGMFAWVKKQAAAPAPMFTPDPSVQPINWGNILKELKGGNISNAVFGNPGKQLGPGIEAGTGTGGLWPNAVEGAKSLGNEVAGKVQGIGDSLANKSPMDNLKALGQSAKDNAWPLALGVGGTLAAQRLFGRKKKNRAYEE